MNLWVVFLTGLTTGGLSCLAMQGGLLASVIANQKSPFARQSRTTEGQGGENFNPKSFDQLDWLPVVLFLGSKLLAYTVLGFFLGALGSVLTLSLPVRLFFQGFAALFMLATAMNLLEVHPIFRYLVLQPPKFMQRWVRNSTKSRALFAPAVLGFLTIFVPCGVTQAMEVVAISSGKPLVGALTMLAFVLGTSPLFALVGVATAKFSEFWRERFLKTAAVLLVFMALYGINGVLTVMDFPVTVQRMGGAIAHVLLLDTQDQSAMVATQGGKQMVVITATNKGYTPNRLTVKQGVPVELTLKANGVYSCAAAFTFNKFKIFAQLKPVDEKTFTFTPKEKGAFRFSCAMGMYGGTLEVI